MAAPFISVGTTLSFPVDTNATNDVTIKLLSFNANVERAEIDTSTMATPADASPAEGQHSATFLPGKLVRRSLDITFEFDPEQGVASGSQTPPPLFNPAPSDAIVLTFADNSTDAWTCAGFFTDWSCSAGLDAVPEGSGTIRLTGEPAAGW